MTSISPIAEFRSKVHWYLDGNTPNFSSELTSDLLVSLRVLATDLRSTEFNTDATLGLLEQLKTRDLQEGANLVKVAETMKDLVENPQLKLSERRTFRDAVVQLILVAECSPDLKFRKMVLSLAQAIT